MGRPNKYPDQFRKDALELVRTSQRPIAEVARSLGIAEARRGAGSEQPVMPTHAPAIRMRCRSPSVMVASAAQGEHRAADRQGDLEAGGGIFRPRDDALIRLHFVQDNQADLPVTRMCELVEAPRSSFYAWVNRTPSARDRADVELLEIIADIYRRSRNTYGAPRIYGQLRRRGIRVAKSRVARLMRTNNLVGAHSSKKWRRGRPDAGVLPDLLNRNFVAQAPNQRWVADVTEFACGDGKLYLAGIRDLYHRGIVGWDTSGRQDANLVVSALTMALARTGHPAEVIHHADRGSIGGFHRSSQHLNMEVEDGTTAGVVGHADGKAGDAVAGQAAGSPRGGAGVLGKIAEGLTSEDAAIACGVSGAVGSRWFRERGGMPTIELSPSTDRYLSFAEREEIALLRVQGFGVRAIAREIGRSPSTISRELRRNAATRRGQLKYRAGVAQWKAELAARRPKTAKLVANDRLRDYVQDRLSGKIHSADGTVVGPPTATWKGRNRPRRQDRVWATAWSPEQISKWLPIDFPEDDSMRISHEAIYQALYIQSRGALKRELVACLRTGRALRVPRARAQQRARGHVTDAVMISERPPEADDRAVPGHWEGDLIIGTGRSAIGTVVDRTTRFTMLVHLPRKDGWGEHPRVKNGLALGGYGAESMRDALTDGFSSMPDQLRRSLTWHRGKELSAHAEFAIATGIPVFFADPHSPWQRGTNENTNGVLRQYFPKGTDLSRWDRDEIEAVATAINSRPRKVLGWKTPAEALDEHLRSLQQAGVASTS